MTTSNNKIEEFTISTSAAQRLSAIRPSSESHFDLMPGAIVDLQISHPASVRLKLRLVGYEMGKYIILKHPEGEGSYADVLTPGNVAVIRYIIEGDRGECCAFKATIQHIGQYPEKFIYISYPDHIENRQLRLHQRVSVHIPADITVMADALDTTSMRISGIVADISERGCAFVFRAQNLSVNVKKRNIYVVIRNTGGEPVKIPARVCNSRNERGKVTVGIQFVDAEQQVRALLEQLFIHTDVV